MACRISRRTSFIMVIAPLKRGGVTSETGADVVSQLKSSSHWERLRVGTVEDPAICGARMREPEVEARREAGLASGLPEGPGEVYPLRSGEGESDARIISERPLFKSRPRGLGSLLAEGVPCPLCGRAETLLGESDA